MQLSLCSMMIQNGKLELLLGNSRKEVGRSWVEAIIFYVRTTIGIHCIIDFSAD